MRHDAVLWPAGAGNVAQIVTSIRLCLNDADLESAPLDACKYQSN